MKLRVLLTSLALLVINIQPIYAANPKYGDPCPKPNLVKTYEYITFICLKVNGKLVWTGKQESDSKTRAIDKFRKSSTYKSKLKIPSQIPTDFNNLYQNRKGIHYAAWKGLAKQIESSKPLLGSIEINIGPNTKPYFAPMTKSFEAVASIFGNFEQPNKLLIYQYSYPDINWVINDLKSKISQEDWDIAQKQDGRGKLVETNCQPDPNCIGSEVVSTGNNLAIMLLGIPNTINPFDATAKPKALEGMIEAHEYFHTIQDIPIRGNFTSNNLVPKNIDQKNQPPVWFTEGGAEWVQNAAVNYKNFSKYSDFIQIDCGQDSFCMPLQESDIRKYLSFSNQGSINIPNFDHYLAYNLGALIVEALVSIEGPNSIMKMYDELGKNLGWEIAFKNIYGTEWNIAYPIIAKTISANISEYF